MIFERYQSKNENVNVLGSQCAHKKKEWSFARERKKGEQKSWWHFAWQIGAKKMKQRINWISLTFEWFKSVSFFELLWFSFCKNADIPSNAVQRKSVLASNQYCLFFTIVPFLYSVWKQWLQNHKNRLVSTFLFLQLSAHNSTIFLFI